MIGRAFRRLSLPVQLATWLGVLAMLVVAMLLLMRESVTESLALQHARLVATVAESLSVWASQGQGTWVPNESGAGNDIGASLDVRPPMAVQPRADPPGQVVTFHRKAPEVAVRELSALMAKSGGAPQFHFASDRPHNQQNAPNRFELTAIESMRADSRAAEHFEVAGDRLLYARRLKASAACLQCHDAPDVAPQTLRTKYPGALAWGFKPGATVGVVSVSVPIPAADAVAAFGAMGSVVWSAVAVVGIATTSLVVWLWGVIRSVRLLRGFADRVVHSTAGVPVA